MPMGKLHTNDDGNDHTHLHCASLAKRLCMPNRRRSYRNTPYDSTQAYGLDDARFRMRIWLWMVASCFESEPVPEGSERWNHETMQRFAVSVANPTSIPDVPSRRRDVSEHDELDERLDEREHVERQRHVHFDRPVHFDDELDEQYAERQRHVPTSSAEPSRTESDRHKRKRDPDDSGINVRRKYDDEGYAELLLEDGLMMTRTTDTFDPQYIGHDEWILQEPYVEPVQVFPILHEPKLDATRTRGLNEELVSKAMKAEMESFRKFDVYDEVGIDDLTPEERRKIIGGRWVLTPKSDTVVKARYVAQGYAQYVEPDEVCATTLSPTTLRYCLTIRYNDGITCRRWTFRLHFCTRRAVKRSRYISDHRWNSMKMNQRYGE